MPPSGYADSGYVAALGEWGRPQTLPHSGGGVLVRDVPGCAGVDAMGSYPIFDCLDWAGLPDDVEDLRQLLVSLVLVTDAFADTAADVIGRTSPALLRPYKEHFVVDLAVPMDRIGRSSRRRTAAKALARLDVAATPGSSAAAGEWSGLYAEVVRRHGLAGVAAYSPASLSAQLLLEGAELLTARVDGELVAAQLCLRRGDVVYSHLGASSELGYRVRAMHGLDLFAVEHFRSSARWFDLGGGNGRDVDGLAAYKASWATGTRPTWLAGWILDPVEYRCQTERTSNSDFFPAYRHGG